MFIARVGDTTGRLSHFYNFPSQQHHQQYSVAEALHYSQVTRACVGAESRRKMKGGINEEPN